MGLSIRYCSLPCGLWQDVQPIVTMGPGPLNPRPISPLPQAAPGADSPFSARLRWADVTGAGSTAPRPATLKTRAGLLESRAALTNPPLRNAPSNGVVPLPASRYWRPLATSVVAPAATAPWRGRQRAGSSSPLLRLGPWA